MKTEIVTTEKTVFGGNTIAKIDSKTVFIPFSMPGETLSINIVQHKNDYDNAEIVKIINPSPYRITPICKYYGICGGCNMMHISPEYQRELRKQMLYDAYKNNKIEFDKKIEIVYGPDYNYRSRFQLNDGGLSEKNGNTIISINSCNCAEKNINDYFTNTPFENRPQGRVHLFGSEKIIIEDGGENQNKNPKVKIEKSENNNIVYNSRHIKNNSNKKIKKYKENHYFSGTVLSPENKITLLIKNKKISFDVRGFFQSNLFVFEKVLDLMEQLLPNGKNVLDMYAGCGSFSAFLADKFSNVTLVEHNRDALVFAEENLIGKKHVSFGLSGENWVKNCSQSCPPFDACVIDPPRSGIEKSVLDYLCKSKIPVIFSVSCDPSTQARDAQKLIQAGYSLERLFLLDFYPNTSHIESLALFVLE